MASNGGALPGRLAAWARRRPEPRLWITVAGTGCVLAVLGVILISGDARAPSDGDEGSNLPGILLCLAVVAAGFALMHFLRDLPGSTAGVTAVVLGLPSLMFFLTFDEDRVPPVSVEAILGGSALVWLIAYLVGPGSGRPVLLATALLFGWLFAIQVVEDPFGSGLDAPAIVEEDPFGVTEDEADDPFADDPFEDEFGSDVEGEFEDELGSDFEDEFGDVGGDSLGDPGGASPTTVGVISVLFGAGYLVGARLADRRGMAGAGIPLAFAGHIALPVGLLFLSGDLEALGTGLAFVVVGALVVWSGALGARRATTVIGAAEIFLGIVLVVGDLMEDSSATSAGVALFVVGGVVVLGAQLLHTETGEPPQLAPGPSSFPGSGRPRRAAAPSYPPAGAPWPGQQPPVGPPPPPPPPPGGTTF
jgi:hypothetical protein